MGGWRGRGQPVPPIMCLTAADCGSLFQAAKDGGFAIDPKQETEMLNSRLFSS